MINHFYNELHLSRFKPILRLYESWISESIDFETDKQTGINYINTSPYIQGTLMS